MPYTRDVDRRKRLLAFFPQGLAPTPERQAALQRARRAVVVLDEAMRILADANAQERAVASAQRIANDAAQATDARRTKTGKRAAMEFVACIKWAAESVIDRGMPLDLAAAHDVTFGIQWPDLAPRIDRKAFRRAVEAWIAAERAMRHRVKRQGRTPERWAHVYAALDAAGLAGGMTDGQSVAKTWGSRTRK